MSNLIGTNFRVTRINADGNRITKTVSKEELSKIRAERLKEIRTNELHLTQKELSEAVGVNLRTLQDWELGRSPLSRPVEKLMQLMVCHPEIRSELLTGNM